MQKKTSRNYIIEDKECAEEIIDEINKKYLSEGIEAVKPSAMSQDVIDITLASSKLLIYFLYLVSCIVAAVVVCIVCDKAYRKERQSLGIYKAYGFTSQNLRFSSVWFYDNCNCSICIWVSNISGYGNRLIQECSR